LRGERWKTQQNKKRVTPWKSISQNSRGEISPRATSVVRKRRRRRPTPSPQAQLKRFPSALRPGATGRNRGDWNRVRPEFHSRASSHKKIRFGSEQYRNKKARHQGAGLGREANGNARREPSRRVVGWDNPPSSISAWNAQRRRRPGSQSLACPTLRREKALGESWREKEPSQRPFENFQDAAC
jgi:hypothetical protein